MDEDRLLYSLVIPVFNPGPELQELVTSICMTFNNESLDYEIILVNDSPDNQDCNTLLNNINQSIQHVSIVTLKKNRGQASASLAGMLVARGDYIITMDDDMQHSPDYLPKLIKAGASHDAAFAEFFNRKQRFSKKIISGLRILLQRIALYGRKTSVSSFAMFSRSTADKLLDLKVRHPIIGAMTAEITNNIATVRIEECSRASGESSYSYAKLFGLFINILSINYKPLSLFWALIAYIFIMLTIASGYLPLGNYASVVANFSAIGAVMSMAIALFILVLGLPGQLNSSTLRQRISKEIRDNKE